MKEATLWRAIKKNLPMVHWQRIESGATAQGIPDLNGCYQGKEVWIELKVESNQLSKWQKNWAKVRRKAGGRVWAMRQSDPNTVNISGHLRTYSYLNPWPWDQILKLLFED